MRSVDVYFSRVYDRQAYNCLHFAIDVWRDITGVDITDLLREVLDPNNRHPSRKLLKSFKHVDHPVDPCLILMHRPRFAPHIGVFVRGKVLHIQEHGVEHLPIEQAGRGFTSVRFYTC